MKYKNVVHLGEMLDVRHDSIPLLTPCQDPGLVRLASAYTGITANRACYQARNKQYASHTLSIGCVRTL
jgi:hypothetical protein